jgi:formate hydrogenlyase transcriptional activator
VPLLVQHLVRKFSTRLGLRIESVAKATIERLGRYAWPGNVRELENILERAVILSNGPTLEIDEAVLASAAAELRPMVDSEATSVGSDAVSAVENSALESLASSTRSHILAALEKSGWIIDGPHGAAKILAVHPNTLRSRMKKLGIVRADNQG